MNVELMDKIVRHKNKGNILITKNAIYVTNKIEME